MRFCDCRRVTVFPKHEMERTRDQGACSREFLLRVIDEIENCAITHKITAGPSRRSATRSHIPIEMISRTPTLAEWPYLLAEIVSFAIPCSEARKIPRRQSAVFTSW
jgi:hypothetical protein